MVIDWLLVAYRMVIKRNDYCWLLVVYLPSNRRRAHCTQSAKDAGRASTRDSVINVMCVRDEKVMRERVVRLVGRCFRGCITGCMTTFDTSEGVEFHVLLCRQRRCKFFIARAEKSW